MIIFYKKILAIFYIKSFKYIQNLHVTNMYNLIILSLKFYKKKLFIYFHIKITTFGEEIQKKFLFTKFKKILHVYMNFKCKKF